MKKLTIVLTDEIATQIIQLLTSRDVVSFAIENVAVSNLKPSRIVRRGGKTVPQHLSLHFSGEGLFTLERAAAFLHSIGYNENTAASTLSELTAGGFVERDTSGRFRFLKPYA